MNLEPIRPKPGEPFGDIEKLITEFKDILTDTAVAGSNFMMDYPEQSLTKTHYRRRYFLRASWFFESAKIQGGKLVAVIASSASRLQGSAGTAPYAKYVQGSKEDQVPMFRNAGWQNVDDLAQLTEERLLTHCTAAIKRWAKKG